MDRRFQRTVEDFVCQNCGLAVTGDGYTNHCPRCLYSLHVDINPGDRQTACAGLMIPAAVSIRNNGYRILHRCQACGAEKWNRAAPQDDFEKLLEIAREQGQLFNGQ
ncbi:MAG: RNHCP domain-containing protein [Anaerolineales bacterium]